MFQNLTTANNTLLKNSQFILNKVTSNQYHKKTNLRTNGTLFIQTFMEQQCF